MPVEDPQTEEEWLECMPLPEYLRRIPRGHIVTIVGDEIWQDGNLGEYTTEAWKAEFGFDPNVAWQAKKKYLKNRGGGVHVGDGSTKFKKLGGGR